MTDSLSRWASNLPVDWRCDWLKWGVRLSTERPTDEESDRLPYIANEDIESWTGKLLKDDPQPAESGGRKFLVDDVLFNKLRPYLAKVYHARFEGVSSGELLPAQARSFRQRPPADECGAGSGGAGVRQAR